MNDSAMGAAPARRVGAGGVVLAVLWILLAAVYTLPLWLLRYVSWDFAISVVSPARMWMVVLGVFLPLLPPLALGIVTWRWMRRHPRT